MAFDPLNTAAYWSAAENAYESGIPLTIAITGWTFAYRLFTRPYPGRPLTTLELAALLGLGLALTTWWMARQLHIMGRRKLVGAVVPGIVLGLGMVILLGTMTRSNFVARCGEMEGRIVDVEPFFGGARTDMACQIRAVPGNGYLPGTLVHPAWNGRVPLALWPFLVLSGLLGGVGLRDKRLRPNRVGHRMHEALMLAPAAGDASLLGDAHPEGRIKACTNATLWGEICGQVYGAQREFRPGEWCERCQQPFTPAPHSLEFTVVSLFNGELDVLNGLERLDTLSWPRGQRIPPDARISGQERWVELGRITLPDVITAAQAVALIHDRLEMWKGTRGEAADNAIKLAQERASRVCGWIWLESSAARLTYARPTHRVRFATGSRRLRDLVGDRYQELTFQLDIGLLPLEMRVGFRKTFTDPERRPELQNSKFDLWIPVGPPRPGAGERGVWVDRIEGPALRTWLATERLRPADTPGVSIPLGYRALPPRPDALPADGEGGPALPAPEPAPAEQDPPTPETPPQEEPMPRAGELDFVRVPTPRVGDDIRPLSRPGASIAEWDWLEWQQIELLRQEVLVLIDGSQR